MTNPTPTTAAGRDLLDHFGPIPLPDAQELYRRSAMGRRVKLQAAILAIEAEARAGLHPDDGYAYEGCNGPACRAVRQEASP